MRKYYCVIVALLLLLAPLNAVFAQEDAAAPSILEQIEEGGLITVNVPAALLPALAFHASEKPSQGREDASSEKSSTKPTAKVGYRVQVFDDNNPRTAKNQAQERKRMIENRFPEFRGYITFNSPYWKVKVGDFRTRSEAEAAMGSIRAAFPSIGPQLRVVRDKINVR